MPKLKPPGTPAYTVIQSWTPGDGSAIHARTDGNSAWTYVDRRIPLPIGTQIRLDRADDSVARAHRAELAELVFDIFTATLVKVHARAGNYELEVTTSLTSSLWRTTKLSRREDT